MLGEFLAVVSGYDDQCVVEQVPPLQLSEQISKLRVEIGDRPIVDRLFGPYVRRCERVLRFVVPGLVGEPARLRGRIAIAKRVHGREWAMRANIVEKHEERSAGVPIQPMEKGLVDFIRRPVLVLPRYLQPPK